MALGAAIGLAALTRQDSLLLLPFAALPATVLAGGAAGRVIGRCALTAAVAAAVVTPWVVRNAIRVHETAIATTSAASALAGANCRQSYNGPAIGYWVGGCARFEAGQRTSEAHFSRTIRDDAITYARAHADRLPVVLSARFARVWGLWDPFDQAWREKVESREYRWQELVWPASLATLLLGLAGLRMLARHGRPIAMLVVPLVTTTVTRSSATATRGSVRRPSARSRSEPPRSCSRSGSVAAQVLRGRLSMRCTTRPVSLETV